MRKNLADKIRKGEELFPGIVGYEESVLPQIENAVISQQDVILLGERGQAKTRIARSLINLLDDEVAIVAGSEINDSPFERVGRYAIDRIEPEDEDTEITWITRDRRYGVQLTTPHTAIADLVAEVDPVQAAQVRYVAGEVTIA